MGEGADGAHPSAIRAGAGERRRLTRARVRPLGGRTRALSVRHSRSPPDRRARQLTTTANTGQRSPADPRARARAPPARPPRPPITCHENGTGEALVCHRHGTTRGLTLGVNDGAPDGHRWVRRRVSAGSYLVTWHASGDNSTHPESAANTSAEHVGPAALWTRGQMQDCLSGLDLVAPGIVDASAWRARRATPARGESSGCLRRGGAAMTNTAPAYAQMTSAASARETGRPGACTACGRDPRPAHLEASSSPSAGPMMVAPRQLWTHARC
jgi:hypothetical protein